MAEFTKGASKKKEAIMGILVMLAIVVPPWEVYTNGALISVIFTYFLLSSYLLKLLVFIYFFLFDLIFIYIYLFICALKK